MRFRTSQIPFMRYIGKSVLEVIVTEEYSPYFEQRLDNWKSLVAIKKDFDPAQSHKTDPTNEQKNEAREKFVKSILGYRSKSENEQMINYWDHLLRNHSPEVRALAERLRTETKNQNNETVMKTTPVTNTADADNNVGSSTSTAMNVDRPQESLINV
jgi:hypothetical protein